MKKRLLSLLLILCLCAALLPVAVLAEGNVIELTDNYINEKLITEFQKLRNGQDHLSVSKHASRWQLPPDGAISLLL